MIKIERKQLSNGLQAVLVTMGEQEGMLLPELAKVLNVSASALHHSIKVHNLNIVSPTHDVRKTLKQEGVVALNAARVNFLPQSTVEALVKIVNTPEAWAVYGQLWQTARAVHSGDIQAAQNLVGVVDPLIAIAHLETALTGWKAALAERDQERSLRLVETKRADDEVVTHGETRRVAKLGPEQIRVPTKTINARDNVNRYTIERYNVLSF
jgi:hypothetical protein